MNTYNLHTILMLGQALEEAKIPYQFTDEAALFIQGVEVAELVRLSVSVQWDLFDDAYTLFEPFAPAQREIMPERAFFLFFTEGLEVVVSCDFNTTVKTDPYRIPVTHGETVLWCSSVYRYLFSPRNQVYNAAIHNFLARQHRGITTHNEQAWNQNNYAALLKRFGEPAEIAAKIQQNPKWRLHPFYKYIEEAEGKRIVHLMGSNGVKATALALLGAKVTVIDFSRENEAYAKDVASQAGVSIDYIVSDILSLGEEFLSGNYDIVLMELGVLHYLLDLFPLMEIVKKLLAPGGRFILHEFHPVSTKLITSAGKKHKVTGNYFDPMIEDHTVAFSKHLPAEEQQVLTRVLQRKWTIGELITAAGQSGLIIKFLEEEPNHKLHDIGLPKTYTLVAEKP
ncbi:class I SAM-dependent methyltransferase [Peribacillus sp. SCS-155]|uniref:class I SAM-dependent methyltransferase n=1 Tax=Peribacillus sedimenti TaxID=3115297 RepID=UPI0039067247